MERLTVVAATTPKTIMALQPIDCPLIIIKLMTARKIAFEAYPNSPHFQAKIRVIEGLNYVARGLLNQHPVIICNKFLSLSNELMVVAPSENSKLRKSYLDKIRSIIDACQSFKNLKTQRHD